MTDNVGKAEAVVRELEAKRRALIERGQEMAETRKRISFALIFDGDARAREAAEREAEADWHGPRWWKGERA